ncbi:unnamed protein product [Macrosiphum euphorbiae]|uniref:Uncharacterized protein n=1 Tax=Macrosiphum euphorbiae TaxID=13131 RepID=A0AAV0Y262_9HEMI|nr:unnamed protein product [Macrosiphum euphorbiae]
MCSAYDRLKKHRQLKKLAQQSNDEPEVEPRVEQNELNSNLSMDIDVSMGVDIICNMINDPQIPVIMILMVIWITYQIHLSTTQVHHLISDQFHL